MVGVINLHLVLLQLSTREIPSLSSEETGFKHSQVSSPASDVCVEVAQGTAYNVMYVVSYPGPPMFFNVAC